MPLYRIRDPAFPSDDRGQRSVAISGSRIWVVFNDWGAVGPSYELYLGYSDDAGVTWAFEQVTAVGQDQLQSGLAIDSLGNLHVVWAGLGWGANPAFYNIRHRVRTAAGVWQASEAITDIGSTQASPQIAVDSSDNLHVTWYGQGWGANPGNFNMRYRQYTAGAWQAAEAITDVAFNNGANYPSIGIDGSDDVHVAWAGLGWGANPGNWNIQYRLRLAGAWQAQEAVTDLANNQTDPSLAIDSTGNVHVAWDGIPAGGGLRNIQYRERLAGIWQAVVTMVAAPPFALEDAALAIDRADNIHVSWSADAQTRIDYRQRSAAGVWGAVQAFVDRALVEYLPMMLWAWHPTIAGVQTNVPQSGEYFIMWPGDDRQEVTCFTNLSFVIAPVDTIPSVVTLPATGVT